MKGIQCYELLQGIALKNHAFIIVYINTFVSLRFCIFIWSDIVITLLLYYTLLSVILMYALCNF